MAPVIFPDNTVFCTFAAVERIGLLIAWLRGRGRWHIQRRGQPYPPPQPSPAQSPGRRREQAGRTPLVGFYELVGIATYDEVRESDADCQVT
jgi:hypothetical protein